MKNIFFVLFAITGLFALPPKEIPVELYNDYTLNGKIPVIYWYFNQEGAPNSSLFFSHARIQSLISKALKKEKGHYDADIWLYQGLEKYPIRGKEVVIIGSGDPWYESLVLAYGGYPTTIEYRKIECNDSRLTVMTPEEYKNNPKKFDVILSISSIEHDGLGRYGDPLNPNADLEFMANARREMLKESGYMILAVPIGKDVLTWNAHRIYGRIRFPMLLDGWEILDSFGFNETELDGNLGNYMYQPIFYLAPKP